MLLPRSIKVSDNDLQSKADKQCARSNKNSIGYISKVLLEPEAAKRWSDRIKKAISSLDNMPLRYPLVNEEPWHTEGIHKMNVDNFIVYYWVDDVNSAVWITAVVYGRRDQISALRNMPKE